MLTRLTAVAALAAFSLYAQTTVRSVANLPSYKNLKFPPLKQVKVPNPEVYTLKNGMKVYLLEDHELPVVSGFALVRTGNLFDPNDKRGLAELTGSVLRSGGTQAKSGDDIDELLENIAASVESNIGEERGSLNFSCLKENLPKVLPIFHDYLTSAAFRQDKVDLAKTQVKSSIARRNDDPGGIATREFQSLIYGRTTPYGWNIEYEHIDNIQRDDMVKFYKRYYFPANIILAVYGDFSTADMKAKLASTFESWDYQQPAVPKFPAFTPKPDAGIFVAEKSDVTQTFFEVGHTGGLLSDKDYPALQVTADILGSGFTSRLMRKVRTELGYAYSISAGWGAGYLHPGVFEISGSTKSNSTVETIDVIQQEVAKIRNAEVTDQELTTAKDTVLNGFVFFFDTPSKTLNRLVSYDYYGYPRDFIFRYQKAVDSVTKADVLRVAKQYLKPQDLTIVAVGNPKEFGKSLDSLKLPVKPIDLTIPEPKQQPAAAADPRGAELLEKVRKSVGGGAKIAAIKDTVRTAEAAFNTGGAQMKAKQVTSTIEPDQFRQEQVLPFGKVIVYSDGKTGWMVTPQGVQAMPPPVLKQVRDELFHSLPRLLLSENAALVADGTIEISDGQGGSTRLVVDAKTSLPLKQTYHSVTMGGPPQDVEEEYSDWREVSGVKLPFHVAITQAGQKFGEVTVSDVKVNTGLKAEDLSKKP